MMDKDAHLKTSRAALTLAALGVVYGDIGTSVLYAAHRRPDRRVPVGRVRHLANSGYRQQ
jgi:K+ transporter